MTGFGLFLIILTAVIVILYFVFQIWKVRKRSKTTFASLMVYLALFIGLAILHELGALTTYEVIYLIAIISLVLVTAIYAVKTEEIAKATERQASEIKKQADASLKMAEEMREQTKTLKETVSLSVRPSISLIAFNMKEDHSYPFAPPHEITVAIHNKGKGPARNLTFTCEGQGKTVEYTAIELPSLDVGDQKQFSISRATTANNEEIRIAYVLLIATYNDELGDTWRATLEINKNEKWEAGEFRVERLFGGNQND